MDILGEAPCLVVLTGLLWGLGIGKGDRPVFFSLMSCLVALALVFIVQGRWDKNRLVLAFVLAGLTFVLGVSCMVPLSLFKLNESSVSRTLASEGTVTLERPWGYSRVMVIKAKGHKYMTKGPINRSYPEGSVVSFQGEAVPFRDKGKDSSFDEKNYWFARGVEGELILNDISYIGNSWSIGAFRTALRKKILLNLPPLTRGHVLASVLGVRDPALALKHKKWGTSHLLAVSGFHVGMVFLLALLLPIRGNKRWFAVSLILWLYVALAGASASALRAAVMAQTAVLGVLWGRRASGVNSVAVAGSLLLLASPWWFWDLGWRLSLICAGTISAIVTTGRGHGVLKTLISGPVLWLATAPLIAQTFNFVPTAGVVLNWLALPFFSVLFPLGVLCSLPALFRIPGSWYITHISEGAFRLWEMGAGAFEDLPSLAFQPWMVFCSLFVLAAVFSLRFRVSFFRTGLLSLAMAFLAVMAL